MPLGSHCVGTLPRLVGAPLWVTNQRGEVSRLPKAFAFPSVRERFCHPGIHRASREGSASPEPVFSPHNPIKARSPTPGCAARRFISRGALPCPAPLGQLGLMPIPSMEASAHKGRLHRPWATRWRCIPRANAVFAFHFLAGLIWGVQPGLPNGSTGNSEDDRFDPNTLLAF